MRALQAALALSLVPVPLAAQQFELGGTFPGGAVWTEGVECADVDADGDLDIFFANGEGTGVPGVARQQALVMNLLEVAPFLFADESVARLGASATHARSVTTGDVDGDGWIDALFAVAFETDPPQLHVNRGASQPGFFDEEGAARGLTEALSSSSAQFGDVDADGDLDLVITDAGADYLGGAGGKARLYRNDGAGVFAEDPASFPVPAQVAPTSVQLADVDADWDLDFLSVGRGGDHALMLNDGAGVFTDATGLLPATTGLVYEAEAGDFDADTDTDLFVLGLDGLQDGGAVNDLLPGGVLDFTAGSTLGAGEDRAVALLDYDLDRDYDAFVATDASGEKLYEKRPGGVLFQDDSASIESNADTTLDITVADLDNDGAYDLVTAQGESGSWENRWYENTALSDPLAALVVRQEEVDEFQGLEGPWAVRAEVRDQVRDDGKTWVSAEASYVVVDQPNVVEVSMAGFDFVPEDITVPAGTTVRWTNPTGMAHTVTSLVTDYPFNSGFMSPGTEYEYTFVTPGVYDYYCIPHVSVDMFGTVTVTGAAQTVAGREIGGGLHRVEMTDAGGDGGHVAYELAFTDWAGNRIVADGRIVPVCGGWKRYGVGVSPVNDLELDGGGSAKTGEVFLLTTTGSPGSATVTFISIGQLQFPFLSGVALFDPTKLLLPLLVETPANGASTNAIPIPANPALGGLSVFFQTVSDDATKPEGWALSNGVELVICP